MSLVTLREYQQEALEEVYKWFIAGLNSQLIVLPTGSGKTILMAAIGQHFNKRLLLLAHREELIQQAVEKFKLYWPEADIGICKAEREEISHQIVIGSVQSCSRPKRLVKLKEQGFEILLIDEAHHASADSYQKIIEELGFKKGVYRNLCK
jgi:superfamily II DNA or RNA helicase